MNSVLAIDTATDACAVAWVSEAGEQSLVRVLPRAHNRHLLAMIDEILGADGLDAVTHLVCGVGPGSFTGLRIAAASVQGLAWPRGLPVAGYCSLKSQAEAEGPLEGWVLSTIDAQIDQLYGRWCQWRGGQLVAVTEPWIAAPEQVPMPEIVPGKATPEGVTLLGSGVSYMDRLPFDVDAAASRPEARPSALIMARRAAQAPDAVRWTTAADLSPRYVQEDVGWKKLAEQGPRV